MPLNFDVRRHEDGDNWLRHWRLAAALWVISGSAGAIASVGLIRRKRWSMMLIAIASTAWVVFDVVANLLGYAKYAYEMIDPIPLTLFALLAVTSFAAYMRWDVQGKAP